MTRFADAIETYDNGIDELNRRYAAAAASDFGVAPASPALSPDAADRALQHRGEEVADAKAALVAQLTAEQGKLEDALDQAAADARSSLDAGPTDANVKALLLAGALPASALTLFPGLRLDSTDYALLRSSLEREGRLAQFLQAQLGTPSADLLRQLDAARAMGLPPRDYAQLLRTYWQAVSLERAGIRREDWDLSRGAAALRPIIEQVYTCYGQLYLDHPELEWAGLANLVGLSFAGGFLDLSMLRQFADRVGGPFDDLPGPIRSLLPPPLNGFAELTSFGEGEIGWYERQFLDMQRQIFLDMGSMNQAYASGGMAAIDEMYDAGLFEMSDNPAASESHLPGLARNRRGHPDRRPAAAARRGEVHGLPRAARHHPRRLRGDALALPERSSRHQTVDRRRTGLGSRHPHHG